MKKFKEVRQKEAVSAAQQAAIAISKKERGEKPKNESVDYEKTAKELDTYAKKHGGMDKGEFEKTAMLVRKIGRNSNVNVQDKANKELMNHVRTMDTDPRDRVAMILKKGGFKMVRGRIMRERTLTPAELKKREKVAKAIERDNPDMPMDKKMAIATATAKKSA